MTQVVKLADCDAVAKEAAERWVKIAADAIAERGAFRIALSGGKTPVKLYELMASPLFRDQVDWSRSFVFWGDEHCVSPSHPESGYRMARELLLDHVPVPLDHVFPMHAEGLASSAVRDYENQIRRHFQLGSREWPRFDLVLLGLGADGHFASIFPGTRAVSDLTNMVVVYEVPKLQTRRMTLTRPVFNNARNIFFLVCGKEKAQALWAALEGPRQPSAYPAQGIELHDGSLTWLVDKAAASSLSSK